MATTLTKNTLDFQMYIATQFVGGISFLPAFA